MGDTDKKDINRESVMKQAKQFGIIEEKKRLTSSVDLLFFLFAGLATFVNTYSLMGMVHFWIDSYGSFGFLMMIFMSNMGGFSAFLFYKRFFGHFKFRSVLLVVPTYVFLMVSLLVFAGQYIEGKSNPFKWIINLFVNYTVGVSLFILRYTYASIVFKRGPTEIAYFNAGMPVAGIGTTSVAMLLLQFMDEKLHFEQCLVYLGFQLACLAWILVSTLLFFRQEARFQVVKKQSIIQGLVQPDKPEATPSQLQTIKLIYPMMYSTFYAWAITLMILPNILWAMGLGWENKNLESQTSLMAYVVSDFIGRISYRWYVLHSTMACHYIGLTRTIFIAIPLFAYASPSNMWLTDVTWFSLLYIIAHGIISGYMSSSLMHIASSRVTKRHKDNAAYLITLATLCGQLYGSMCNLVALKLGE